jgi:hypothetical protein
LNYCASTRGNYPRMEIMDRRVDGERIEGRNGPTVSTFNI